MKMKLNCNIEDVVITYEFEPADFYETLENIGQFLKSVYPSMEAKQLTTEVAFEVKEDE